MKNKALLTESEYNKITSKRIVRLLKNSDLTQGELADLTGVSMTTVNGWFNDGRIPKSYAMYALANTFDMQYAYLCEGSFECDKGFRDAIMNIIDRNEEKGLITIAVADMMRGIVREAEDEIKRK